MRQFRTSNVEAIKPNLGPQERPTRPVFRTVIASTLSKGSRTLSTLSPLFVGITFIGRRHFHVHCLHLRLESVEVVVLHVTRRVNHFPPWGL